MIPIENIYVYVAPIPGAREMVSPCCDGYTIWIDSSLDEIHRMRAYQHALEHIRRRDFEGDSATAIEAEAHNKSRSSAGTE